MLHVFEDLAVIVGDPDIQIHMIPRLLGTIEPWLREHATDPRLWDGEYDLSHTGEYELPAPSEKDRGEMLDRFKAMPDPLKDKPVIVVKADAPGNDPEACDHPGD